MVMPGSVRYFSVEPSAFQFPVMIESANHKSGNMLRLIHKIEPPGYRQNPHIHSKGDNQHQSQPEARQRNACQARHLANPVQGAVLLHGANDAQHDANNRSDEHRKQRQLNGGGHAAQQLRHNRLPGEKRGAPVALEQLLEKNPVLGQNGLVQPQISRQFRHAFRRGPLAKHQIGRIGRKYPHEHEHDGDDAPHHGNGHQKALECVFQQCDPSGFGISRFLWKRISYEKIRCPLHSRRGQRVALRRLQLFKLTAPS